MILVANYDKAELAGYHNQAQQFHRKEFIKLSAAIANAVPGNSALNGSENIWNPVKLFSSAPIIGVVVERISSSISTEISGTGIPFKSGSCAWQSEICRSVLSMKSMSFEIEFVSNPVAVR